MQEGKEWIVTALTNYLDKKKYRKEKFLEKVKTFFKKSQIFAKSLKLRRNIRTKISIYVKVRVEHCQDLKTLKMFNVEKKWNCLKNIGDSKNDENTGLLLTR